MCNNCTVVTGLVNGSWDNIKTRIENCDNFIYDNMENANNGGFFALILELVNCNTNQAQPLSWDTDIATYSQNWSNYLLLKNLCLFQGYNLEIVSIVKLKFNK